MRAIGMAMLVAVLACDASPSSNGYGSPPGPADMRGGVDGGTGAGTGTSASASGGHSGSGGSAAAGQGGTTGAGGAAAGMGGMSGAGGSATGGRAGAGPDTQFCADLGYPLGFTSCVEQPSPGVFISGKTTDGHACVICKGVPAGIECWASSARELCVASCTACVFQ